LGATFAARIAIENVGPPAGARVGRKARICGAFDGELAFTANTTVLEVSDELETNTFTDPIVTTSFDGIETCIVVQLFGDAHDAGIVVGLRMSLPK